MLRTDGSIVLLDEDRFELDRVWVDHAGSGTSCYYFGWRTSIRQALRLVLPDTPFVLTKLFMWGGPTGSMTAQDAPKLGNVGAALDWLGGQLDQDGDLIDLECLVGQEVEMGAHDDTEVTLSGKREVVFQWASRLLESRGFDAAPVMAAMDLNAGKCLAIKRPGEILGVYDTLGALVKAHPER